MAEVDVLDATGAKQGSTDLDESVFGIEPNVAVMHQVVTAQLAARRAGTQSTKTRSEVRGGGAKPWKQKGTGRARAGSIRAPQWKGGGVALGPKPRSYKQKTPKKMVRLALRSALSDRAGDGKVLVVREWGWDAPRTKDAASALAALGTSGRVLVVVAAGDEVAAKSFRNLPDVHLLTPGELNAHDVLVADWLVFTEATLPGAVPSTKKAKSSAGDTSVAVSRSTDAGEVGRSESGVVGESARRSSVVGGSGIGGAGDAERSESGVVAESARRSSVVGGSRIGGAGEVGRSESGVVAESARRSSVVGGSRIGGAGDAERSEAEQVR